MIPVVYEDCQDQSHPYHGVYLKFLYDLLKDRLKQEYINISHKRLPTYEEHVDFVNNRSGYLVHFIICNADKLDECFGCVYITENDEIGVHIATPFQHKGYGSMAVMDLLEMYPGKYYANINPLNTKSIKMFEKLGFKPLQVTYTIDSSGLAEELAA